MTGKQTDKLSQARRRLRAAAATLSKAIKRIRLAPILGALISRAKEIQGALGPIAGRLLRGCKVLAQLAAKWLQKTGRGALKATKAVSRFLRRGASLLQKGIGRSLHAAGKTSGSLLRRGTSLSLASAKSLQKTTGRSLHAAGKTSGSLLRRGTSLSLASARLLQKALGRILHISGRTSAAILGGGGSLLQKAGRAGLQLIVALIRILGATATGTAKLLARLISALGRASLLLLRGSGRLIALGAAATPKLLALIVKGLRQFVATILYLWQVLAALVAFLLPHLRRLLKIMRAHLLAVAVTGAGAAAIVLLLGRGEEQPVDERQIPIKQRPAVTVAALLSLTGRNSAYGMEMLHGYRIAADAINEQGITVDGRLSRIDLLIYDDESNPHRAGELAEQIAAAGRELRALLAPYSSLLARPAAVAAARQAIPVLAPAASAAGFDFVPPEGVMLLQSPPAKHLLPALELIIEQARQQGIDPGRLKIALAWRSDPHSAAVAAGISDALARRRQPPPLLVDLSAGKQEFISQSEAAADADVLFVAGYGAGAARIMQQLDTMGRRPPIVALTHCTLGRIGSIAPRAANGALCIRHWQPEARHRGMQPLAGRAFVSAFQSRHGRQPSHHAAASATALIVIAAALRKLEKGKAADLQQALATTRLATFYGPIGFDERGINDRKPMIISQLQFGKYVPIWPPAAAAGSLAEAGFGFAASK